jgi:phosphatidylglycerol:prolipoprotein diacylglycerol transferase
MSFHGGLAGGLLAGAIYLRKHRLPVLAIADAAAPGLALGYAIGRVGCLLNGCCYGGPTTLPWGLHFPHTPDPSLCYHPAQIYASFTNLAVMGILVCAYRKPHRVGQVLALYIGLYSVYRFMIEFLRKGVTADVLAFGLTQAQVFSLFAIAAAAGWWLWLAKNSTAAPEAAAVAPPVGAVHSKA